MHKYTNVIVVLVLSLPFSHYYFVANAKTIILVAIKCVAWSLLNVTCAYEGLSEVVGLTYPPDLKPLE